MSQFNTLTKYLPLIEQDTFGKWIVDEKNDGTPDHPFQMPYVDYSEMVYKFIEDVDQFVDERKDLRLHQYRYILEKNKVDNDSESFIDVDITLIDGQYVVALIVWVIRAERFSEGTLLKFFKEGYITKWLKRLRELDIFQN